jgi:hypothetical protein
MGPTEKEEMPAMYNYRAIVTCLAVALRFFLGALWRLVH